MGMHIALNITENILCVDSCFVDIYICHSIGIIYRTNPNFNYVEMSLPIRKWRNFELSLLNISFRIFYQSVKSSSTI